MKEGFEARSSRLSDKSSARGSATRRRTESQSGQLSMGGREWWQKEGKSETKIGIETLEHSLCCRNILSDY